MRPIGKLQREVQPPKAASNPTPATARSVPADATDGEWDAAGAGLEEQAPHRGGGQEHGGGAAIRHFARLIARAPCSAIGPLRSPTAAAQQSAAPRQAASPIPTLDMAGAYPARRRAAQRNTGGRQLL